MKESTFECELWLPYSKEEIFQFFSNAANLQKITPDFLHFRVVTPQPIEMREGALIDYRLKLRGIPIRWRTRITAWEPPGRFVDEQVKGPYSQWIHEHTFIEKGGGTLCRDFVRYKVPGGWLIDKLFVNRDVEKIFAYRQKRMKELFPERQAKTVGAA